MNNIITSRIIREIPNVVLEKYYIPMKELVSTSIKVLSIIPVSVQYLHKFFESTSIISSNLLFFKLTRIYTL